MPSRQFRRTWGKKICDTDRHRRRRGNFGSVLEVKSARTKNKKQNSELGKDSGGMMMINNCKITRGRPTVLAGGMSITRGVPRATKSVAHDISPARSGPDNNKWKKIG